jgi:hypothetical protein
MPSLILRTLRSYISSLEQILQQGHPKIPGIISTYPNEQVSIQVFPITSYDRLLFNGVRGDVLFEPGVQASQINQLHAKQYEVKQRELPKQC